MISCACGRSSFRHPRSRAQGRSALPDSTSEPGGGIYRGSLPFANCGPCRRPAACQCDSGDIGPPPQEEHERCEACNPRARTRD
ncbi:uncharacterized protein LAESUDRAFT_723850 [Laetiporus sulphureus 93-53]|uniref:Uncharacterized protein n=1 Tax=Laetiporus sulphureus 93-53 TaxID=1314785 RepID=A0A165F469_9APHY|nr:uncharacterized protein LAESUDRAFT_723850 [Laetiporus sulphureus 93-53]KZT08348.1 hypothetical protein LAESUDRAFT_723850 [Laetiporus sulphureus 93-53]